MRKHRSAEHRGAEAAPLVPVWVLAGLAPSWGTAVLASRSGRWPLVFGVVAASLLTAAAVDGARWKLLAPAAAIAVPLLVSVGPEWRQAVLLSGTGLFSLLRVPARLRRRPPVTVLGPVMVMQLGVARDGSGPMAIALAGSALVASEFWRAGSPAIERVEQLIVRSVRRLADWTATSIMFAASAVLLYLPGGLVRLVSQRSVNPPISTWEASTHAMVAQRDARLPFRSEPRRARRSLAVGVAFLAALALVAYTFSAGADPGGRQGDGSTLDRAYFHGDGPLSELEAYRGVQWADELDAEHQLFGSEYLESSPVSGVAAADFDGKYTTVVDGERATTRRPCSCEPIELWLLGGSAAFGIGQRDSGTIASHLVDLADQRGIHLHVRNFGVPGWTVWQEYGRLSHLLSVEGKPELVVFLDGFNDVVGTVIGGTLRGLDDDRPSSLLGEEIETFISTGRSPLEVGEPEEFGRTAALRYRRVMSLIVALTGSRGVDTAFFFQPDALADEDQLAAGRAFLPPELDDTTSVLATALDGAATDLEPSVHNLRHLLVGLSEPVFADLVHTNERGAAMVAEAVLDRLEGRLRALR